MCKRGRRKPGNQNEEKSNLIQIGHLDIGELYVHVNRLTFWQQNLSVVNLSEICFKVEVAEGIGVPLDDGEGHCRHCAGSLQKAMNID